jgi:hypothetical protein
MVTFATSTAPVELYNWTVIVPVVVFLAPILTPTPSTVMAPGVTLAEETYDVVRAVEEASESRYDVESTIPQVEADVKFPLAIAARTVIMF